MEMPLAQPAGVSEPPWMLPGNSSMPVSRQLMPRMWPSPSPRTLLEMPRKVSICFLKGSSGDRMRFKVNSSPSSSGQKCVGTMPLGLNISTSRCLRAADDPRLGNAVRKGITAAETPRSRMNCLRVFIVQGRGFNNFDHQLLNVVIRFRERAAQALQRIRAIRGRGLLDHMMKQLLDEAKLGLFAFGGVLGHIARAREADGFALAGGVFARGIHGLLIVRGAVAPDRIIVLQTEPQRVDDRMTALT